MMAVWGTSNRPEHDICSYCGPFIPRVYSYRGIRVTWGSVRLQMQHRAIKGLQGLYRIESLWRIKWQTE